MIFVCSPPEKSPSLFFRSSSAKPKPVKIRSYRCSKSKRSFEYRREMFSSGIFSVSEPPGSSCIFAASEAPGSSCVFGDAYLESAPSRMHSSTVMSGFSTACCRRVPIVKRRAFVSPEAGFFGFGSSSFAPVMTSSRVVLPAPFRPTMAALSFPRIQKSKCDRTGIPF